MKRAFVTGGTGFLGSNLIEQLVERDWHVTALHRASSDVSRLRGFGISLVEGDLFRPDNLAELIPEDVDAVFHVAGNTSIWRKRADEQTRDNVEGTRSILQASTQRGARRFVYTSTWATFGLEHDTLDEETEQTGSRALDNYSRSKHAAEQLVLAASLPSVVMNPAHILGRYDTGNWSRLITMVDRGTLPGIPPGAGSFCHAAEVARAHIAAAEHGRTGHHYLLGGTDASFVDVIAMIGEKLGKRVPRRAVPRWLFRLIAQAKAGVATLTGNEPDITPDGARMVLEHPRVTSTRAALELGYRSPPLPTMLDDAIGWMRSEGLLTTK
ncbi:MAG: NAD-dependent epimerase/dehydratase family protein [Myxococcota bacterium]